MISLPQALQSGFLALAAFFLSGCGTDLYLDQAVPAKINMGRASRVWVGATPSSYGQELTNRVESSLTRGGYYTIVSHPSWADVALNLDVDIHHDHSYNSYDNHDRHDKKNRHDEYHSEKFDAYVACRALSRDGQVLGSQSYRDTFYDRHNFPANSFAEMIVKDVTPHTGSYSVNIATSDEKPLLKQAAEACADGNWVYGQALAQEYVKQTGDPEGYFLLGVIDRKSGNDTKADQNFRKAMSLDPATGKYAEELARTGELRQRQQILNSQWNNG